MLRRLKIKERIFINEITKVPDLQLCPSCGGTPVPGCVNYGHHFIDSMAFNVECAVCGLKTDWCRKPQEAVDIWNETLSVTAKQICEECGIEWDENATEATLRGKPVSGQDIRRAFGVKEG